MSATGRGPRTRALVLGVAAVGVYLAGAVLSAHLSVLARGPLFDGLAPPPPYRWVKPPPSLAGTNQPALSGTATLPFKNGRSQPGVFRTDDSQAVIVMLTGSVPPQPGATSVKLTITPLAPAQAPKTPSGLRIDGNVYRFTATYEPNGEAVTDLATPGELVLVYPTPTAARHVLLFSADAKRWVTLRAHDSQIQQQLMNEKITQLGLFATALRPGGSSGSGGGGGRSILVILIVAAALVAVGVVAFLEYRRRKAAARAAHRRPPARKR
jgi:hypothetical protein